MAARHGCRAAPLLWMVLSAIRVSRDKQSATVCMAVRKGLELTE